VGLPFNTLNYRPQKIAVEESPPGIAGIPESIFDIT